MSRTSFVQCDAISTLTARFVDPALERGFLLDRLHQDRRLVLLIVVAATLFASMNLVIELNSVFRGSTGLGSIVWARIAVIAVASSIAWGLTRVDDPFALEILVLAYACLLYLLIGYVVTVHPEYRVAGPTSIVSSTLVAYLFAPARFSFVVALAGVGSAVQWWCWSFLRDPAPPFEDCYRTALWILAANAFGALSASTKFKSQRRLFIRTRRLEQKIEEAHVLEEQLREQALRDPLTGLHNRRYLYEVATDRLEMARRQSSTVSVALLDIDHFKRLNDEFGHDTGDLVLRRFSDLLTSRLRRSDVLSRVGGEEFVLLAGDAEPRHIVRVLEELVQAFGAVAVTHVQGEFRGLSFSAGVAVFPIDGGDIDTILKVADARLYEAKRAGRARVCARLVDVLPQGSPGR